MMIHYRLLKIVHKNYINITLPHFLSLAGDLELLLDLLWLTRRQS